MQERIRHTNWSVKRSSCCYCTQNLCYSAAYTGVVCALLYLPFELDRLRSYLCVSTEVNGRSDRETRENSIYIHTCSKSQHLSSLPINFKSNQSAKGLVIYHSTWEQINKAVEILWKLIMHQIISRLSTKSFKVFPLGIDWSFITSICKWRYSKENTKSLLSQLLLELLLPHKILRPWKMKGLKCTLHREYYCLFWGVWVNWLNIINLKCVLAASSVLDWSRQQATKSNNECHRIPQPNFNTSYFCIHPCFVNFSYQKRPLVPVIF